VNPRHLLGEAFQADAYPFAEVLELLRKSTATSQTSPKVTRSASLRPTDLVVKTAQDVLAGARMVVLHELDVEPGRFLNVLRL